MEKLFDIIIVTRKNFLKLVDSLTIEQLNKIPEGYSNNIAWNFGHIIASQQTLCYVRAGLEARMPVELINKYKIGSKPEGFIDAAEIETLKGYLLSLIDVLKKDISDNAFQAYQPIKTSVGLDFNNVDEVVPYFMQHDSMHLGYAMAMKKVV
jgi:hypothetical protein